MKTKGMEMGKVGGNSPAGGFPTGTDKTRMGGEMPAVAALPTTQSLPYLTGTPMAAMTVAQATDDLAIFTPMMGNTDTGAQSTGDLGGAA